MCPDNPSPQITKQQPLASVGAAEFRYIPVYEAVMGSAFALIAVICTDTLIGKLAFGSSPSFDDLILLLVASFIGATLAVLSFRYVSRSWLRMRLQEDIELHWWLRRITHRVPRTNAQAVQLTMYISPIFGMGAEAILILTGKDQSIDLPVLRHILPSKKFRSEALQLAQNLQIPLLIPERNNIPPGFLSSFETLKIDCSKRVSESAAQTKPAHETEIESLIEKLLLSPVTWQATGDQEFPHHIDFAGQHCEIRVNDWPEYETVYSLIIAKKSIRNLHSLPDYWKLPDYIQ